MHTFGGGMEWGGEVQVSESILDARNKYAGEENAKLHTTASLFAKSTHSHPHQPTAGEESEQQRRVGEDG